MDPIDRARAAADRIEEIRRQRNAEMAEAAAERFVTERLNGTDGLGGIFAAAATELHDVRGAVSALRLDAPVIDLIGDAAQRVSIAAGSALAG